MDGTFTEIRMFFLAMAVIGCIASAAAMLIGVILYNWIF